MLRLTFSLAFSPVHTQVCWCCCNYRSSCCCCSFSVSGHGEREATGHGGRASSNNTAAAAEESPPPPLSGYVCTHSSSSASDVVVVSNSSITAAVSSPQPAPMLCGDWWRLQHTAGEYSSPTSFSRSKRFGVSLVGALILITTFSSCTTTDSGWNSLLKDSTQFLDVANRAGTPVLGHNGVPGSILFLYTSWVWRRALFPKTETTTLSIVAGFLIRDIDTTKCDLSFFESECSTPNIYLNVFVQSPLPKPTLLETTEPGLYQVLRNRFLIFAYNLLAYGRKTPVLSYSPPRPPTAPSRRFTRNVDTIMVPLYGSPNRGYCAMVAIGSVGVQQFCVLVDTGSSNLAIAATAQEDITQHFNISSADASLRDLGSDVSVSYTGGEWSGRLATDVVSVIDTQDTRQSTFAYIALIQSSENFFIRGTEWEGIMGLAYPSLAKPDSSVEPYWDSMRKARGMRDIFSLQLCPPIGQNNSRENREQGGQLILGGHGENAYTGSIFYTSIVQEDFYRVLITNMSVGGVKVDVPCREFNNDKAIVDSGTTDIYLATDAFEAVLNAFLEYVQDLNNIDIPAGFWSGDSKLALNSSSLHLVYTAFPTLYVAFASHENQTQEFSLGVTPQLYLRQVQGSVTEQSNLTCHPTCDFFVFGIKQRRKGTVIGGNIMLGFATVFDRELGRIGFAMSTCQYQDNSNETLPFIIGYYPRDMMDCRCVGCSDPGQLVRVVAALAATAVCIMACIVLLAVMTLTVHKLFRSRRKAQQLCCSHRAAQGKQISEEEKAEEEVVEGVEETCGSVENRGMHPYPSDLSVNMCASEQPDTSNHERASASISSSLVCGSSVQSDTSASGSSNLTSNPACAAASISTFNDPTSSSLGVTMCTNSESTAQSCTSAPDEPTVQSKSSITVCNDLNCETESSDSIYNASSKRGTNVNVRNTNMRDMNMCNSNASTLREPDHELDNTENEHTSTRQSQSNDRNSGILVSAVSAVSWMKREGYSFIWNLKSKITRKDKSKSLLIMQCEDAELESWGMLYSQELNNTTTTTTTCTGASNCTEHVVNPVDSVDSVSESAHQRTDVVAVIGRDLLTTDRDGQNTTPPQGKLGDVNYPKLVLSEPSSSPQHNSMVGIGDKSSSYSVDESYPKLALSESPLSSLTGSLDVRLEGDRDKQRCSASVQPMQGGIHAAADSQSRELRDSPAVDQSHATASGSDVEFDDRDELVDSKILPEPETILDDHHLTTGTPHNLMSETNSNCRGNYTQKPSQNTTKQQAHNNRRQNRKKTGVNVTRSALVDRDRVFPLISEERQNLLNNSETYRIHPPE